MASTMPATRLPVVVNQGAPSSLYDTIYTSAGGVAPMAGATVLFFMRPLASRTPSIAGSPAIALSPPDNDLHNVRYDWTTPNVATEGDFFGWWRFTLAGGGTPQETMEFPILISDHGPGLGTQTGAIVDGVRMYLPITFDYLQRDKRFGDRALQQNAELIKAKVLGYTVTPDQEQGLELVLLDFLSKRVALELITPGIDFWSRQMKTATSTNTQEVSSYPDMIASLKDQRLHLAHELTNDWRDVKLLVPDVPQRKVVPMPVSSLAGLPHVSRNPQQMPRLHTGNRWWTFDGLGTFPFP